MNNGPSYYQLPGLGDVDDIIKALGMSHHFRIGNILKYVIRAGRKEIDPLPDLKKAKRYLDAEIADIEQTRAVPETDENGVDLYGDLVNRPPKITVCGEPLKTSEWKKTHTEEES